MAHDLFSSLDSFVSASVADAALMVRDVAGDYRLADADEVLLAAQRLLAGRVRGADMLNSPAVVKDFLRARLSHLPHEVFAVVHLDSQLRVVDYVEMFRGTVAQTSVYPREMVKDALLKSSSAVLFVFNHPSGLAEPSRADEVLTQTLKAALQLVDVRVTPCARRPNWWRVGARRSLAHRAPRRRRHDHAQGICCIARCAEGAAGRHSGADRGGAQTRRLDGQ